METGLAVGLRDVSAAWGLELPVAVRPTGSGVNNRTYYVDAAGGAYLLRLHVNTRDVARVRYEHAILLGLGEQRLSFRVPEPLRVLSGDTLVVLEDGTVAALFPVLPGTPPDRTNLGHIRACGAALAELHAALLGLDVGMPPAVSAMYGELERIHPLVPDPWSLPDALPLELDEREQLRRVFETLRGEIPGLYAALPRQVCHNDYGPGNTLAIDGKTSAILDFEFAGPDVRAIDVAVGWYWSVGPRWGAGDEMATIGAFLEGYGSWAAGGRLTSAEAEATPVLARLHGAAGLVHWVGRGRAGLAGEERVLEHAQRLLDLDRWLDRHAAELIVATGAVSR